MSWDPNITQPEFDLKSLKMARKKVPSFVRRGFRGG
jgi:hypothetical protein